MSTVVVKPASLNEVPKQEQMGASMIGNPRENIEFADVPDVAIQDVPCIAKICTCFPLFGWMSAITCVNPNTHQAILHCGRLTKIITTPGVHCIWGCHEKRSVSVMQQVKEVPKAHGGNLKVVDRAGSPLIVSAILNYRVVDAKRALFAIDNFDDYVQKNASAILKHVVATHTYDELKTDVETVNRNMLAQISPIMSKAGIQVASMVLNEMNYATEIAAAMLKKQQAGALIEARELIVEGAVKIAQDAIRKLEEGGTVTMQPADKVRIVTNLLTVTCGDKDAQPTVSAGA
jgi:regulator of protease activity HflC (stomatin/prohibitin superfamily)